MILIFLLNSLFVSGQIFEVDTIQYSGDVEKRINLVILSDGYQKHELPKFVVDAGKFTKALFSESPYAEYQNYFNVFVIKVPSNQSGASHPGTATDVGEPDHPVEVVDNYFGSSFDQYGIHRLLVPTKTSAVTNVLANNFPSYDHVLVLVNSPYYGGSGGWLATASLHSSSSEVAIHELGHSIVGLKDEYYAGDGYASEAINMTKESNPSKVKWKNWNNHEGVGAYQHCCGGSSAEWYRPHESCKMRYLGASFCSVCKEGTIERIHSLVSPIDSYLPEETTVAAKQFPLKFQLNLIKTKPNTLKVKWVLNGSDIKGKDGSLVLNEGNLKSGKNTLTAFVQDTTKLLRVDKHESSHSYAVSWTIENMAISSNANASGLVLSQGTFNPAFAPDIVNYKATVPHATASVTVTPKTEDSKATVKVNEKVVTSGNPSSAIPLQVGSNVVSVVVTAQDGKTTKKYTIDVVRENAPKSTPKVVFQSETKTYSKGTFDLAASSDSKGAITYEVVEELTANYPGDVALSGPGNKTVTIVKAGKVKLRAKVAENDQYLAGSAEMELTIQKAPAVISITELNQPFNKEPRPVVVATDPKGLAVKVLYNGSEVVPSAAGEYKVNAVIVDHNYTGEANAKLTISPPSAVVSALSLSQGTLSPAFAPATLNYKASVPYATTSITLTPNLEDPKATARVNAIVVASDTPSSPIPLNVGSNSISVVVTAQDGIITKTYTIEVVREKSSNANAAGLVLSQGTLNPAFAPGTTSYKALVDPSVPSVTVTPTVEEETASVRVNEVAVISGSPSSPIPLTDGSNIVSVVVSAQNGTTKTYIIEVVREHLLPKATPGISFQSEIISFSKGSFDLAAISDSRGTTTYEVVEELTVNYPGDVDLSGPGNKTVTVVKAGKVKLRANVAEDDQYVAASAEMELTIEKAPAKIIITELDQPFNGEPRSVAITTEPEGLPVKVFYNGSAEVVPTAAGEHNVLAVVMDDNYSGEASAILVVNMPTSVSNPEMVGNMKLYPNPTTGRVKLELDAGTQAFVRVRDLFGRLISQTTTNGSCEVDLENFAAGIYLVEVQPDGKSTVTFKLQKQ